MGNIIRRRRRLRWMGHVGRMEGERRAVQCTLYRQWTGVKRGSVEEADRERTGRKLYVKTSDA